MEFKICRTSLKDGWGCCKPCDNTILKEFDNKAVWTKEIDTFKELMKFVNRYDRIILTDKTIEIYDANRE